MLDIIKQSIDNNKSLVFFYPSSKDENEMVQREVYPVCYGKDKNGTFMLRAIDNDVPKLWIIEKIIGIEIGNKIKEEIVFRPDKVIVDIIGKVS